MCCVFDLFKYVCQSCSCVVTGIALLIGAYFGLKTLYRQIFPPKQQKVSGYIEQWYGKGPPPNDAEKSNLDTSVRKFEINVSDEVLKDLNYRLEHTRFEDPVEDSKFFYGFNPNYLREVIDYWRKKYDWRKHEKELNKFPQFKTRIEGIDVHFVHVKPELPKESKVRVIPLMVIHGWPGSVVEFYKLIPLLTTPRPGHNFVFEVICPSIPGYGFSESPHQKGLHARAAARMFLTLMERLGHRKFYVQGGDWGSVIAQFLAKCYSPRIIGVHLNMVSIKMGAWAAIKYLVVCFFPFLVSKVEYRIMFPLKKLWKLAYGEGAYFHMQSTKPDTLGCGMADSPAGTAAYLLEKFSGATSFDCIKLDDGGLTKKFTMDELLTNVMLYWTSNNFTAAARFYKENLSIVSDGSLHKMPITIPTGISVFPNEVILFPKFVVSHQMPNIVSYNIMPRGGHFAALEEPELLADDVWQFVKLVQN